MLKGCQKKIYYMKNTGGKYFEEAYLVLRADLPEAKSGGGSASYTTDLAAEAERIVRDAACFYKSERSRSKIRLSRGMSFALGAASSSAVIGLAALLMSMA